LRFIAVVSVVLLHLYASLSHNGAVPSPFAHSAHNTFLGKQGVELFFVISGFILGLPFAKRHISNAVPIKLQDYFLRRVTRLEPPYIVNLFVCLALLLLGHQPALSDVAPHLLLSAVYLHHLFYNADSIINGVTWSLEVEVQFYGLAPLLSLLFAIRAPWMRRAVLTSCVVFSSVLSAPLAGTRFQASILYYLPFFLAGFVVVDLYLATATMSADHRNMVWDGCSVVGWPIVWMLHPKIAHLLLPFLFVLLILAAFRGRVVSRCLSSRWVTDVGGMCYTIYLYHFVLISVCGRLTKPLHIGSSFMAYFALQMLLILPVVLIVCTILYLLVERPCMDRNWPWKLAARLRRDAATLHSPPALPD